MPLASNHNHNPEPKPPGQDEIRYTLPPLPTDQQPVSGASPHATSPFKSLHRNNYTKAGRGSHSLHSRLGQRCCSRFVGKICLLWKMVDLIMREGLQTVPPLPTHRTIKNKDGGGSSGSVLAVNVYKFTTPSTKN